jgi:CobQ-like glutamine amidotransferase family enzyme
MSLPRESAVRVGLVYPELLGTYGDRGNAVVLVRRLRWRGQAARRFPTRSTSISSAAARTTPR